MIEVGESKGEFPITPHKNKQKSDNDYETPNEVIDFAVSIMKTYFESMNDEEYDCMITIV